MKGTGRLLRWRVVLCLCCCWWVSGVWASEVVHPAQTCHRLSSGHLECHRKIFRVGLLRDAAQWEEEAGGNVEDRTLSAEVVRFMVLPHGVEATFHYYDDVGAAQRALINGAIDVLPGMVDEVPTQRRLQRSAAYMQSSAGVVTRKTAAPVLDWQDLTTQRVALLRLRGPAYLALMRAQLPRAQILTFDRPEEALAAVADGSADAYVDLITGIWPLLQHIPNSRLHLSTLTSPQFKRYFFSRRNDTNTTRILQTGIAALTPTAFRQVIARWHTNVQGERINPQNLSENEQQWLRKHPVLKVGIYTLGMPYDYFDEKQNWVGIGRDILVDFSRKVGVHLEPVWIGQFSNPFDALRQGVVDVIPSMPVDRIPLAYGRATTPYQTIPWGIMRINSPTTGRFDRFDRVAGVLWRLPYLAQPILQHGVALTGVMLNRHAIEAMVAGQVDAAVMNIPRAQALIYQRFPGLLIKTEILTEEHVGFVVAPGLGLLSTLLTRHVNSYSIETLDAIARQHSSGPIAVGYRLQDMLLKLWPILTAVILIMVGLAWINVRLHAARRLAEHARRQAEMAQRSEAAANAAKSHFVACVSHEVRTPMSGVIGVLDLLEATVLSPLQQRYVSIAGQAARHLQHIVNDVLDVAKIDANGLTLLRQEVDLYALLQDVYALYTSQALQKGIAYYLAVMPHFDGCVFSDEVRLKQIIGNLLSNALRFTAQGEVELYVRRRYTRRGTMLDLSVRDTGVGMSAAFQRQLFTPFHQETQCDSLVQGRGTGLGLVIVKRVVEAMQGELRVQSEQGVGTTITVTLPLEFVTHKVPRAARVPSLQLGTFRVASFARVVRAWVKVCGVALEHTAVPRLDESSAGGQLQWSVPKAPVVTLYSVLELPALLTTAPVLESLTPVAADPMTPTLYSGCVLVVEDDAANREILARQLTLLGAQVLVASNGQEGIDCWRSHRPRVIFTDCQMPICDGFEMTRQIRCAEQEAGVTSRALIIAVSAGSVAAEPAQCHAVGMDDCLPKPVTRAKLRAAFEQWGLLEASDAS